MIASDKEPTSSGPDKNIRLMAAIMVAVDAYLEGEERGRRPVVRGVAPRVARSSWKSFGLIELMRARTQFTARPLKRQDTFDRADGLRKPLEKVI